MTSYNFPLCCTAKVIANFGESDTSERGNFAVSEGDLEMRIKRMLESYSHLAFLCATTNSDQKTANKVLKRLKFKHTKWMAKTQHPETKVRFWWKPLEEYKKECKEQKKPKAALTVMR